MAVADGDLIEKQPILSRFNKLPTHNHATILLVGVKGIGVDDLVNTMLATDTSYSVQMRTTTSLPLPKEMATNKPRPRIDYIVFIIDLSNQQSFTMVKEAVELVNIDYFCGQCCFLLSKAKQEHLHNVDISEVTSLVEAYDLPMICGNLEKTEECQNLVDKIFCQLEIACGFCNDASALLVDATRQVFITEIL